MTFLQILLEQELEPLDLILGTIIAIIAIIWILLYEFNSYIPEDAYEIISDDGKSIQLTLDYVLQMANSSPDKWTLNPDKIMYEGQKIRLTRKDAHRYICMKKEESHLQRKDAETRRECRENDLTKTFFNSVRRDQKKEPTEVRR